MVLLRFSILVVLAVAGVFCGDEKEFRIRTNRIWEQEELKEDQKEFSGRWQDLETTPYDNIVHFDGEKHLANVKQLTFGGMNAEGYFSFDNSKLTLQATGYGTDCDQIYELDLNIDPKLQTLRRISTGLGGTTCSYFYKEADNNHRLYAGNWWNVKIDDKTDVSKTCPQKKCANPQGDELKQLCNTSYTWDIFPDYDIFKVDRFGNFVQRLTDSPGYDAEGVVSPDGTKIAFTSIRSGDLELYVMNTDGTNLVQVTNELGYDGGSFFTPDGKRLIFRASRPKTDAEIAKYKKLLSYDLVEPIAMELFIVDIDGKNMRQITHLGEANWAPYMLNDNKRIVFSSNYDTAANGFGAFSLYMINDDGTGLEQITFGKNQFNSFAMQSYDGKKLVWGSSRNGTMYELNLFIADWIDNPDATTNPVVTTPVVTSTPKGQETTTNSYSSHSLPSVATSTPKGQESE
ncbi:CBN-TAG-10 protein [Caenorhabditis brenneri]|uniref:CBN-TAG-10 protein n=1 Tax=Caenorhabditis brenneri TaxID=135651 RepID=G0P9B3_CAEBE|nr:CBN-TAG-10 protein [Caenorhabditis brenneri]